jgi:hypothetical protein
VREWDERGVWFKTWRESLSELNERRQLEWSESFLDGSFAPAKKGARKWEKPSGEGAEADGAGRRPRNSFGDHLCSASPAEVKLAETTLASIRVGRRLCAGRPQQKPLRVIADKGYDRDALLSSCDGGASC